MQACRAARYSLAASEQAAHFRREQRQRRRVRSTRHVLAELPILHRRRSEKEAFPSAEGPAPRSLASLPPGRARKQQRDRKHIPRLPLPPLGPPLLSYLLLHGAERGWHRRHDQSRRGGLAAGYSRGAVPARDR